jgi:hypothetical protein
MFVEAVSSIYIHKFQIIIQGSLRLENSLESQKSQQLLNSLILVLFFGPDQHH